MSKVFDDAFLRLMKEEGVVIEKDGTVSDSGYGDDKDDPGGETKFGISAKYLGRSPKELTLLDAKKLCYEDFYKNSGEKVEGICPAIAILILDINFNMGPLLGARYLQIALGVIDDGIIGPVTLGKLRDNLDKVSIILGLMSLARTERYARLALLNKKLLKFLPGWIIRTNNLHRYCATYK